MNYKILLATMIASCSSVCFSQDILNSEYTIAGCRYWFDGDKTVREAAYSSGMVEFDVATLEEGFHTLHYQVAASDGSVAPTRTAPFYRIAAQELPLKNYSVSSVRYWFDGDKTVREAAYSSGMVEFDVATLEEGFHTLHYQVTASDGSVAPTRTAPFYRIAAQELPLKNYSVSGVRYWFDGDKTVREAAYSSGMVEFDVATLEEGFHTLHYQVTASDGSVAPTRTAPFYRIAAQELPLKNYSVSGVRYWFDGDKTVREAAYSSGMVEFDVATLEEGFHTLHYQVTASDGSVAPTRTAPFYRIAAQDVPLKNYTLKEVKYWIDGDIANAVTSQYDGTVFALDLSHVSEGDHILYYQVSADSGDYSPVMSTRIDRRLYDIYITKAMQYSQAIIDAEPLLASRPDLKLHYDAADLSTRGHLTITDDATLSLGKFVQTANLGSGSFIGKLNTAGIENFHPTTLINNGTMRADSVIVKQRLYRDRWHFLSLPFNVNISDIDVPVGTYTAIRRYDGEQRAAGNMSATWVNLGSNATMEGGLGYILQLTSEKPDKGIELVFKSINDTRKNNIFTNKDVSLTLETHESEFAHNRSWNLVGNPYPSFYDSRYIDLSGTITVWNGNGYSAYSLEDDSYIMMPFEAFFVQKPVDKEAIEFSAEGRQHDDAVRESPIRVRKSSASGQAQRRIINLELSDGNYTDRTRIVFNEQASAAYESDKDAVKFMSELPNVVQLFSEEDGVRYAINERPLLNGCVALSIYSPSGSEYMLSPAGATDRVFLTDKLTGEVADLSEGGYSFYAGGGLHEGRFIISAGDEISGIDDMMNIPEAEMSVSSGKITIHFAVPTKVTVYGVDGRIYYSDITTDGEVELAAGVYIVSAGGKNSTVVVK